MSTATTPKTHTPAADVKAFEDKIKAQVAEARVKLDQFEAKAREKRTEAETKTISHLKSAQQEIDRKLKDLKATNTANVEHAKSDIQAHVAKFKVGVDGLATKFKAAIVVALILGASVVGLRAADHETLVYAVYDGQGTAAQVFKTMQAGQKSTGERIESYAVVSKDVKGAVTVGDQRKRDAGVGAIIGGVVGLVGGPIGVAAGATAGGAVGFLTGDAVGIPRDKVEEMRSSLTPNSSALIVVLDDKWVNDTQKSMNEAHARAVIAHQILAGQKKS